VAISYSLLGWYDRRISNLQQITFSNRNLGHIQPWSRPLLLERKCDRRLRHKRITTMVVWAQQFSPCSRVSNIITIKSRLKRQHHLHNQHNRRRWREPDSKCDMVYKRSWEQNQQFNILSRRNSITANIRKQLHNQRWHNHLFGIWKRYFDEQRVGELQFSNNW